jgi:glutathione S-transferase
MTTLRRPGVEVEYRNIREDSAYRDELLEARGKTTVPVLRIGSSDPDEEDEWMLESADIVQYLADRFGDGEVRRGWLACVTARYDIGQKVGVLARLVRASRICDDRSKWRQRWRSAPERLPR